MTRPATDQPDRPAWPPLPTGLRERAVYPDDPRYRHVRSNYMRVGSPGLVVMARHDDEVTATIRYADQVREATGERIPFSFRSGGHGMTRSSVNDGGIVLDVSRMNRIELTDPETGLVTVGAGAIWGDVAETLAPHDLVLTSGNYGDTGVGGLATSGGVGFFVRSHGLTIDRVLGARLVTADGASRWVDAEHEPDLFWAVRGGSSQIGMVTDFLFRAEPLHSRSGDASVINQMAHYQPDDLGRFVARWGDWIRRAPREMTSFLMIRRGARGPATVSAVNVWAGTDTARAVPVLEDAAGLAELLDHSAILTPYPRVVPTPREAHRGQQHVRLRDVLVDHADVELGTAAEEALSHRTTGLVELRSLGGAVADVDPAATAWAGRHQEVLAASWVHPRGADAEDDAFAPLRRLGTGAYGAYSSDIRPTAAALAWPGPTGTRLRDIIGEIDPRSLFDQGLHLDRGPEDQPAGAGAT